MKVSSKGFNWDYLFLFLAVLAFFVFFKNLFWPQLNIYATSDLGRSEIWNLNYPLKDFLSHSLKNLEFPFWSKNTGGGYPVFAEGLIGTLYLPNLFLFGLLPTPLAWNLSYVLIFILIFAGTYLFIVKNSKNVTAGIFGALVFTFCGYNVVHIPHYPLIQAVSLFPLLIFSGQNLTQSPTKKNIFFFAFILSQQIFIGHPQVTFMTLIFIAILTLFNKGDLPGKIKYHNLLPLITGIIFGFLLAAPQILPSLELLPLTTAGIRGFDVLAEIPKFPYLPKYLATILFPDIFGSFRNGSFPGLQDGNSLYWEINGFIGIIPLLLAIYAVYRIRKNRFKKFLLTALTISVYICFSYIFPLRLLFLLPGFNLFRVTSRFLLIVVFSLSVLAGTGLKDLMERIKNRYIKNLLLFLVFVFSLLPLLRFGTSYNPTVKFSEFLKTPKIFEVIENDSRVIDDPSIYSGWNDSLKKEGQKDMTPFLFYSNTLSGYLPLMHNISNMDAEISAPLLRQAILIKYPDYTLMGANSVDYLISIRKLPVQSPLKYYKTLQAPKTGMNDIYIYKNSAALPRFRLVSDYEIRPFDFKDPDWNFTDKSLNFGNAAILEKNPGLKPEKPDFQNIAVLTDNDWDLALNIKTDKATILIVGDTFYPGWTASVNGKRSHIMNANFNQRALGVPAGDNIITFRYIPYSFYAGVTVFVLTLLVFYKINIRFSHRSS